MIMGIGYDFLGSLTNDTLEYLRLLQKNLYR